MGQYQDGTVDVTNGSAIVTGYDTEWLANASVGDGFKVEGFNAVFQVAAVVSDTEITLSTTWSYNSQLAANYQIHRDFTPNLNLPEIWAGDKDWPYHLTVALRILDGLVETAKKANLGGSAPPGVDDDELAGYEVGSMWIDTSASPREVYRCVDATAGAAVWVNTSLELGELGSIATQDANAVDIDGGSIDGTDIGQTTPAAGRFTVLHSDELRCNINQQLVLNAGESYQYATGQTTEYVYLNAEGGLEINSSPDNWVSGWASRNTAHISKADGTSSFPGDLDVNGNEVWHAGNDGSGSGLDADKLDGLDSLQLARTDIQDEFDAGLKAFSGTDDGTAATVRFGRNDDQYIALHGHAGGGFITAKSTDANKKDFIIKVQTDTDSREYRFNHEAARIDIAGNEVWHAGNDGSGSGLDADTVDGLEASQFLRSDAPDTASAGITFNSGVLFEDGDHRIIHNDGGGNFNIRVGNYYDNGHKYSDDGSGAIHIEFAHETTTPGVLIKIGEDPTGKLAGDEVTWARSLYMRSDGMFTWNGYTIWTADNDGSGSGLDADKLDGYDSSSFQMPPVTESNGYGIEVTGDWNDYTTGGFYRGHDLANETPYKTHVWQYTIVIKHSTNYCMQIAKGYNSQDPLCYRTLHDGTWYDWQPVWSEANDGSGSGLDADTVDGFEASQFLRSDVETDFASDVGLSIGSGPGAIRFFHISADNRSYIVPRGASDWLWAKQITFDADDGQWNIEGEPRAGGYEILHVGPSQFDGVTEKSSPVMEDVIVIEDSADSNNKKRIQLGNIPSTGASSEADIYQDVLGSTEYQNATYDDFNDESLTDAANTDMDYDQNNTRYNFTAGEKVQSDDLFDSNSGLSSVTECMVLCEYTDSGTPTIEVTADGTNWQTISLNEVVTLTDPGTTLKLRFTGGATGYVESWAIFYNPDEQVLVEPVDWLAFKDRHPDEFALNGSYIINGGFDIWQRATSQTASGCGSDDRWFNANVGSTKTHSRNEFAVGQTDVPGSPRYYSRTVVTSDSASTSFALKYQKIEGVRTLDGQTATLSFWAKADSSKDIVVEFIQDFGTGGSPTSVIQNIGTTTVALTATWQKYTVTVDLPSILGKTIGTDGNDHLDVVFWFDAGSGYDWRANSLGHQNGTFDIAQVKLEDGSVATDFVARPYAEELALCQRYYEKTYSMDVTPGTADAYGSEVINYYPHTGSLVRFGARFKTTKRSSLPTIYKWGTSGAQNVMTDNQGTPVDHALNGPYNQNDTGFLVDSGPSGGEFAMFHWAADAEL